MKDNLKDLLAKQNKLLQEQNRLIARGQELVNILNKTNQSLTDGLGDILNLVQKNENKAIPVCQNIISTIDKTINKCEIL